ncbi:MAG: hypothetical protein M3P22_00175 [bacterium]|nr:hypothetical protein [bacterium]
MKKNKKSSVGNKMMKGAIIAGVASAAYMLMGPDGKKNQAKLKSAAMKVKNEVVKDAMLVKKMVTKDAKIAKKVVVKNAKVAKKEIKEVVSEGSKKVNKW